MHIKVGQVQMYNLISERGGNVARKINVLEKIENHFWHSKTLFLCNKYTVVHKKSMFFVQYGAEK